MIGELIVTVLDGRRWGFLLRMEMRSVVEQSNALLELLCIGTKVRIRERERQEIAITGRSS